MYHNYTELDLTKIKKDDKITLVKMSEIGYPISIHIKIDKVFLKDWAQYKNCLQVQGKPPRKRKIKAWLLKPNEDFVIYKGFVDLEKEMGKLSQSYTTSDGVKVTQMGFCFNLSSLRKVTSNNLPTIFNTYKMKGM